MFHIQLIPYLVIMSIMGVTSVYFISRVIARQLGLFKIPIASHMQDFRKTLFKLAIVVFLGNFVPLLLDLYTIHEPLGRPDTIRLTSLIYAVFLHTGLAASSFLIWKLYQLAESVDRKDKESHHTLINEEDK